MTAKDRIMQVFLEEAQTKSMKVTMDDIAQKLGMSKRTLYEHFSSKTELINTIIEQSLMEMDDKADEILKDDSFSLLDKIKGLLLILPRHYQVYDLRILEQMKRYYPEQWKKLDDSLREDWDVLRLLLEQGIEEGIIADNNMPVMMKVIIEATNTIIDQQFFVQNKISLSDALSAITDMLFYGIVKVPTKT